MSTAYQMSLRINVPGKRRDEALSLLRPLVQTTRVLPECLTCVLHQDEEHSASLCLIEEWIAEAPLIRHVQSDAFRVIFEAMEMSAEVPELRFCKLQDMGGLDYVEQLRKVVVN